MQAVNVRPQLKTVLLALTLGVAIGLPLHLSAAETEETVVTEKSLPLDELRLFTEVFQRIKSSYVEPVDDAELLENALRGMIAGLDPHSAYLEADEFEDLQAHTSGEFGGLGIEVGLEDGFIRVITPIDDTPAQRAGVKAGDLITKLGDQAVQGMDLSRAIGLMRGKPGSKLILTIVREGEEKPLEIEVVRDIIQVASVKSRMLDDHYAYLRVTQFQVDTGKELNKHLKKLQKNALKGAVLDLRNNPGGVLQAAVDVSDAFISDGLVVYTQGRITEADQKFSATKKTQAPELPLVVLINGGSASASEIVAGALQDSKRAIIMGLDSFGKGSVQTVLPLTKERALKLTTARYFTPGGRSIQAQGIIPDMEVPQANLVIQDTGFIVKEADLSGHIANGLGGEDRNSLDAENSFDDIAKNDFQLFQALSVLKAFPKLVPQ